MRALLVILVLANLAFAAWAVLVDRPAQPPAARDISHLPQLALAGQAATAHPAAGGPGAGGASSAPAGTGSGGGAGSAAGAGSGGGAGDAQGAGGAGSAGRTAGADTPASGGDPSAPAGGQAARCVTVGPFPDLVAAANAAASLQGRGLSARQRDAAGKDLVQYWVYLDGLSSDAQEARVLQQLRHSGIADAHAMPVSDEGRRVSVGLFTERAGAERRARDVRRLGLAPQMAEQRHRQAAYWVDVSLGPQIRTLSTAGLLPGAAQDAHLQIDSCPAEAEAGAGAASGTFPAAAAPPVGRPEPD